MHGTRYVAATSHGGYHRPWIVLVGEWEQTEAEVRAAAERTLHAARAGKAAGLYESEVENLTVVTDQVARRRYINQWDEYWDDREGASLPPE